MRLEPPQLGRLLVSLTIRDGVVTAAFRAENAEVRDLLQASLPQLKEALAEEGVTVGRFEAATSGEDEADSHAAPEAGETPFGRRRFGGEPRGARRTRAGDGVVGASVSGARNAPRIGTHGIDILA